MIQILGDGAGHVSIVYLNPTSSGFTGFDQNWSTPGKCHLESHTYNHALGFLRPKGSPGPEPPGPTPGEEGGKNNYKKWLFSKRRTIFLS